MRARIGSLLLIATLSGCATAPSGPPPALDPIATCTSKPQCDAMWSEALVQVQNISGMRLQMATDNFAQTYTARGPNRMTGTINKVPQPDGKTAFEVEFICSYSCGHLPYTAINLSPLI